MNSRLTNKTEVLSKLGTFWVKNTSREDPYGLPLVRAISRVLDEDGARAKMVESEMSLLGDERTKGNYSMSFFPADVYAIHSDTAEIAMSEGSVVLREFGDIVPRAMWTSNKTAHYVIQIPDRLKPISIRSELGELCVGVSFSTGPGWIRFYVSPHAAFPDRLMHIRCARERDLNILDYTLRVDDAYTALPYLAEYYRSAHSAEAFELALNEIAGRVIIANDAVITEVNYVDVSGTYVYTTSSEDVYRVAYEHFPLVVGDYVYKKQVIGKAIEVHSKSKYGNSTWWEPLFTGTARGNSISLQDLNPALPAVTILNEEVRFWAYEAAGATFHVRAEFTGDVGELNKYFAVVKQGELWADKYWNDVTGFVALNEEDDINGLAFMFTHALHNAVIIDIDIYKLGNTLADKIEHVARRELPIGCVPIIRKWSSVG